MADFEATGVQVGTDGVTSSGDIAAAGKEITGGKLTATEAAVVAKLFEEATVAAATVLDVNSATGDDGNDGVAAPVASIDRAEELVPDGGLTIVRVSGAPVWTGGSQTPRRAYRGNVVLLGMDAPTVVDTGTVAAYTAGTGDKGRDQITPTWTAHPPADATDRSRFMVIEDDLGTSHMAKIVWEDGAGNYEIEPIGITVTGANPVSIVDMTTDLSPASAVFASPFQHQGSVLVIGCVVTSPGLNGLVGLSFAACQIVATAHDEAVKMGYNSSLGRVTADDSLGLLSPAVYCPTAYLTGSALDGLVNGQFYPGSHLLMPGGATAMLECISPASPGCGAVEGLVYEGGKIRVGNPDAVLEISQVRGADADSGVELMDGASCKLGLANVGAVVKGPGASIVQTGDVDCLSYLGEEGYHGAAGTGVKHSLTVTDASKAGGDDSYAIETRKGHVFTGIILGGNGWPAATAMPSVALRGKMRFCNLTLGTGADRGAGDLVDFDGCDAELDACSGDNPNAGGTGASLTGLGTRVSVANGFAITGNGTGTTTIGIGKKGHVALPAAGNIENDLPAGPTVGDEQLCVFEHRA